MPAMLRSAPPPPPIPWATMLANARPTPTLSLAGYRADSHMRIPVPRDQLAKAANPSPPQSETSDPTALGGFAHKHDW